jgi:hypothetical protein
MTPVSTAPPPELGKLVAVKGLAGYSATVISTEATAGGTAVVVREADAPAAVRENTTGAFAGIPTRRVRTVNEDVELTLTGSPTTIVAPVAADREITEASMALTSAAVEARRETASPDRREVVEVPLTQLALPPATLTRDPTVAINASMVVEGMVPRASSFKTWKRGDESPMTILASKLAPALMAQPLS